MVSGLIEQEDVSPEEHSTSESKLHLPTTRETTDSLRSSLKPTDREGLPDLRLFSKDTLVIENELQDRSILLTSVNIVLDIESADFVRGRNLTTKR